MYIFWVLKYVKISFSCFHTKITLWQASQFRFCPKQSLRQGLECRQFMLQLLLGNSSEGTEREREDGKINNECIIELINTVGNWSSLLLGTSEDPVKSASKLFHKRWETRAFIYQLSPPTGQEFTQEHYQLPLTSCFYSFGSLK